MLSGYSPEIQTLLGTLLTWGLTAAGAGLVFFVRGSQVKNTHVNSLSCSTKTFLNRDGSLTAALALQPESC